MTPMPSQLQIHAAANDDVRSPDLPQLLIIHQPVDFARFESQFSKKFHLLKAWESPLPLDQFLMSYAGSVKAMLFRRVNTQLNADILCQLPALKLIVTSSAGINHIDVVECRRRGISVTNVTNAYSEDVADMAVGLFIDVYRKISAADRFVRQGLGTGKRNYPPGNKVNTTSLNLFLKRT